LLLAKIIATITLGADKIQRLTLKSIFNCTASKVCLAWKKAPLLFLYSFFFSFLSPNNQKTENQSESNSGTSWTPNQWKASLHCSALKKGKPFLPASQLQSCLHETTEGRGYFMNHVQLPTHPLGK
jgi:hypothetical protein